MLQRGARRVQLADTGRRCQRAVPRLRSEPHHSEPVGTGKPVGMARSGESQEAPRLFTSAVRPAARHRFGAARPPDIRFRAPYDHRPSRRRHHGRRDGGRRGRARAPAAALRRALSLAARPFASRERTFLLDGAGTRPRAGSMSSAPCSETSAWTTRRALACHQSEGPPADWHVASRLGLCQRASVGGLGGDLGALSAYGRCARYGGGRRHGAASGRSAVRVRSGPSNATTSIGEETFEALMERWVPLTIAMNSMSRSMGHADFYPVRHSRARL